MVLKLIGATLIIFAGTCSGFAMAKRCAGRPDTLRRLLSCVAALRSCISYASMPLSESLLHCASGAGREMEQFFGAVASMLQTDYLMQPREAFEKTLAAQGKKLALRQEDCDVLLLLACNIGSTDKKEQEKYLLMIERRLEILEREASSVRDHSCKMYRYLGVCGSLMVILLLI